MPIFSLLAVSFIMKVVAVIFALCCLSLVLIVLIQKGKGGGLSGALGGGAMSSLLGSQSKGPLTWITIVIVCVFLLLAIVMAKFYKPSVSDYGSLGRPAASVATSDANTASVPVDE